MTLFDDITNKLPSFFVVGAQKAGTTTLHNWLNQQPGFCLPKTKETHFFSDPSRYARGLQWYINQYHECEQTDIYGEIYPDYGFYPDAAGRIKNVI